MMKKIEQEKIKEEQQKNLNQIEMLRKNLEVQNNDKVKAEQEKVEKAKKRSSSNTFRCKTRS